MLSDALALLELVLVGFSLPLWHFSYAQDYDRVDADVAQFDKVIEVKRLDFEKLPANPSDKGWVKLKINYMVDIDQYLRETVLNLPWEQHYDKVETQHFYDLMMPRWKRIDTGNTEDLRGLMRIYTWFKISVFGEDTSEKAWLLAQHADLDRAFQREVLKLLEGLFPNHEVLPKNYAYLYDRVTWYADEKPQRYATQGMCKGPSDWEPHPTEDMAHVDTRRAEMGMVPWVEQKKVLDPYCH